TNPVPQKDLHLMPAPNRIHITTRAPAYPSDPGWVATGWYSYANNVVTLTDANGEPVPGGYNVELQNGENAQTIARQLLRKHRSLNRSNEFNAPISYPPKAIV